MWSGCLGDIEWGMCEVRDPLGNALKMVKKHIKSAEKSNNQNGWRGIKQSKSHKYHFPIPLVFRIKTIKIPGKSREMDNTAFYERTTFSRFRFAFTHAFTVIFFVSFLFGICQFGFALLIYGRPGYERITNGHMYRRAHVHVSCRPSTPHPLYSGAAACSRGHGVRCSV